MGRKTLGGLPICILMGQREQFDTHWMRISEKSLKFEILLIISK